MAKENNCGDVKEKYKPKLIKNDDIIEYLYLKKQGKLPPEVRLTDRIRGYFVDKIFGRGK